MDTFKQITEKLKKFVIEPKEKQTIFFDDMEDETGLNIGECMTSAQMGPAPTPNLGSVVKGTTVNGTPVEGKSVKKKKLKKDESLNTFKLTKQLERILEGEVIDFTDFRNKKLGLQQTISDDKFNDIRNNIIKDLDNNTNEVEDSNSNYDALNASYVKDYRKDPQDVQVGDILSMTWGYSMTIVDYYKVIERKKSSIRLAALNTINITGDGWSGTCIPGTEIVKDDDVDGKLFRIGTKWSNEIVCRINGHGVYYWDGKPDAYDRND